MLYWRMRYEVLPWMIIAIICSMYSAYAEVIGSFIVSPHDKVAVLLGEIGNNTSSDFDTLIARHQGIELVALNSGGGAVTSAIEIARKINALGISTYVEKDMTCASACSIIYFAGKQRVAAGRLGVHQMSTKSRDAAGTVQLAIAYMLDAFQIFQVDFRVIEIMLTTPPHEMYFFSENEKAEFSINRVAPAAHRATAEPKFADFPANSSFTGKVKFPDFSGRDRWARMYRTRIREGVQGGPNFAGTYAIVEIGCGTSCRFAYLVDVRTGAVMEFPLGGEENYQLQMVYSLQSRIVKAVWMDTENDQYDTCVAQDFEWNGNQFVQIMRREFKAGEYNICIRE